MFLKEGGAMNISYLRKKLYQAYGKKIALKTDIKNKINLYKEALYNIKVTNNALYIVQEVSKATQADLQYRICSIVTKSLQTIFPEKGYEFKMEMTVRRNKTEAEIFLEKDGERYNPMDDNGGGVVDVVAFALRLSCFLLNKGLRKTIILDEPFRFIQTSELREKCALLVRELSNKLGIQFIIIVQSHQKELIKIADRRFQL